MANPKSKEQFLTESETGTPIPEEVLAKLKKPTFSKILEDESTSKKPEEKP